MLWKLRSPRTQELQSASWRTKTAHGIVTVQVLRPKHQKNQSHKFQSESERRKKSQHQLEDRQRE